MRIWAITGGIACGKSTVAELLRGHGCTVYSADDDARAVVEEPDVRDALMGQFAGCFVDGHLDRRRLADRIYADPDARRTLNGIMHPAIRRRMRERIAAVRADVEPGVAFYEVPLLYEGGLEQWFDGVVAVTASRETQVRRLQQREHDAGRPDLDTAAAEARLAAQMDPAEKARRADFKVDTDQSWDSVKRQVDQILAGVPR